MIRTALKNPYLVIVHVLIVAVIGTVSLARIPADLLPTFTTSAAQIVCFYPGMPPEVMEQDIMSRLQRWTGQSSGIEHQEAKAMQGVCVVKDFFHPNISQAEALSQVSMYAMSDMFYLPPGTIPPMVMPFDPTASVPLCLVSVSNPDMTDSELYDVAYKNLRNNLQSISGVIAPAVNGGSLRRILCYVEPEKLRAHGLTIRDVHAALRQQNVLIPAGSAKIQDKEFYIYTNAIPDRVAQLNSAPITIGAQGEPPSHPRLLDWLAVGLDPERSVIFRQSDVPLHAELHLLLSMIVPVPWLERVPSYKEQQQELSGRDLSTYGFLGYPLLQAADILMYKAIAVPVGEDQLPHIEFAREVARRFNRLYSEVFPEPKGLVVPAARVPGTDGRKMSTDSKKSAVGLEAVKSAASWAGSP